MKSSKTTAAVIVSIVVLCVLGFALMDYISFEYSSVPKKSLNFTQPISRVLVVAPHSDDETLGCAEFIKKSLARRGTVKIVIITNGDGSRGSILKRFFTIGKKPQYFKDLGRVRYRESLSAMSKLGVSGYSHPPVLHPS